MYTIRNQCERTILSNGSPAYLPVPGGEGRGLSRHSALATADEGEHLSPFSLILLPFCLVLIAGCATKSPPTSAQVRQQALTNVALPSAWKAGGPAGRIADDWLATFHDAQLDALVREALSNNLDLRVTAFRVGQAAQYVEVAKAAMRPAINLAGTGGLKAGGGSDLSSALQGIMLAVSWEPDLWGRIRYGRNAAREAYAASQADFEFARQSLAATVAKSWFTATETWLEYEIVEDTLKSTQQLLSLAERRHEIGSGNEQDVALARANLGTLQDNSAQLQFAYTQALRALELLLGRYPAAELKASHNLTKLPGPVPVGMPLDALERRPDLIAAERRVAAAFNRVGEAKAARLPRLTLNAGVAALDSQVLQLKTDYSNPSLGMNGKLIAPIYQGGALNAQVKIRTLEQQEAVADYARMALRALGDVENALAAGSTLAQRDEILQRTLADNQRGLSLAETSFRVGKSDTRAVQEHQLTVYSARLTLLRVQSEQLSQRVNLHLALGGSFAAPVTLPVQAAKK
jgi:multidrug efflux system outer membrane protein